MDRTQSIYTIRVRGQLDPEWSIMLNGLAMVSGGDGTDSTIFVGPVRDQAALRGIMNKLWDLNLTVLSLKLAEEDAQPEAILPREQGDRQ